MLAERSPQMKKAVGVLKELSADEQTRMIFEAREIARRDIVSMLNAAIKQRDIDIARTAIDMNMSNDTITKLTGLSIDEVESLRDAV